MANLTVSDIVPLVLLAVSAVSLLLARTLRRRKRHPPHVPLMPDLPAVAGDELIRALAEVRPDPASRPVRESVKVFIYRYESEREHDGEG